MPFDPSGLPSSTVTLIAIRDRITRTWRKGYSRDGGGCLLQHLAEVAPDIQTHNEVVMRLKAAIPWHYTSVSDFNDNSTTKIGDVVALLDSAIAGA